MTAGVASYQTVKLAKGKHHSPDEGACVMELASMLAGEPFTDRPYSVSPAIAGFLRAYNDYVDDELRQDLYRVASAVVRSRANARVERMRLERIIEWGKAMRRSRSKLLACVASASRYARAVDISPDEAGTFAVRGIGRDCRRAHAAALALVDDLLSCGRAGLGAGGASAFPRVIRKATWSSASQA